MILLPAIDLKGGKAVRLKKGDFNEVTVYSEQPWKVAKEFEACGAGFIHLVDLDGALEGESVNSETIKKITSSVNIPCELGGGIRDVQSIRKALDMGVSRVILGTIAVKNPKFVKEAVDTFGSDKVIVGIDAKNGYVAISGWEEVSKESSIEFALKMKDMGVKTVIYTDISRDGMLTGPNIETTKRLKDETGLQVIASGGMSCMDDLKNLAEAEIDGAIIGKAYYEKKINLKQAVEQYGDKDTEFLLKKASEDAEKFDVKFSFDKLKTDKNNLIPVIVQDYTDGTVLMLAYMDENAFNKTCKTGVMTYYSRSRKEEWVKGLTSGHYQIVKSLKIDCDNDTLLAQVKQIGAACHTGNRTCFYRDII